MKGQKFVQLLQLNQETEAHVHCYKIVFICLA